MSLSRSTLPKRRNMMPMVLVHVSAQTQIRPCLVGTYTWLTYIVCLSVAKAIGLYTRVPWRSCRGSNILACTLVAQEGR